MNTFLTIVLFIAWLALVVVLSIVAGFFTYSTIDVLREKHKTTRDVACCVIGIPFSILIVCIDIIVIAAPFI